jgi:hypothetical protein
MIIIVTIITITLTAKLSLGIYIQVALQLAWYLKSRDGCAAYVRAGTGRDDSDKYG